VQIRKYGKVLFNKEEKSFDDGEGYLANNLDDAFIYNNQEHVEAGLSYMDEPKKWEIWDIEIMISTINNLDQNKI
jgi:hypothetical protein